MRSVGWDDVVRGQVQVEFRRVDDDSDDDVSGDDVGPATTRAVRDGHRHGRPAALEREKDIPFDVLDQAIEQALLVAYQRTEGASRAPGSSWTARPGT